MHLTGTTLARSMSGVRQSSAMDAMREEITPEKIVQAICQGLSATHQTKRGLAPDHRTRLESARVALAYLEGKPINRVEAAVVSAPPDAGALVRLLASPAARARLQQLLDRAEPS